MGNIYDGNGNLIYADPNVIESYFETELAATVASVRAKQDEPCLTFAIVTDVHYNSVDKVVFPNTIRNIKALSNKVKLDGILCLGDMTDGNGTQAATQSLLAEILTPLRNIGLPVYFTAGNHDCNAYSNASYYFTTQQMYANYYKEFADDVFYDDASYGISYYKDFDGHKIRMICMDATNSDSGSGSHYKYSASTVTWFTNKALATVPTGYAVMFVTHLSPTAAHNWNNTVPSNASSVLSALNTFVSGGGDVFSFFGHSHSDYSYDSPWLEIAVHCNKKEYSENHVVTAGEGSNFPTGAKQWAQIYGTATEDCWDVAVIKPYSKEIETIRFGAGEDRSFSY